MFCSASDVARSKNPLATAVNATVLLVRVEELPIPTKPFKRENTPPVCSALIRKSELCCIQGAQVAFVNTPKNVASPDSFLTKIMRNAAEMRTEGAPTAVEDGRGNEVKAGARLPSTRNETFEFRGRVIAHDDPSGSGADAASDTAGNGEDNTSACARRTVAWSGKRAESADCGSERRS
jgi:hypothetical protein